VISETADAYQDASQLCPPSTSAAYHARFLRSLVSNDVFRARRNDQKERRDAGVPIDPRLQSKSPITAFYLIIHFVYKQVCPVLMRHSLPRARHIPIKYNIHMNNHFISLRHRTFQHIHNPLPKKASFQLNPQSETPPDGLALVWAVQSVIMDMFLKYLIMRPNLTLIIGKICF
jgi:hypothetical protein